MDLAIATLADDQHGVLTRSQLLALGLGGPAIGYRLRSRRLVQLHRGVYALGHAHLRPQGHWMAAVLACGPTAVLSHRSAAALWGLRAPGSPRIDVAVAAPNMRRHRDGIRAHRLDLRASETTTHEGIPATTPARTLLDLAAVAPEHHLRRAVEEAERLRIFDGDALEAVLAGRKGRAGAPALRGVLDDVRSHTLTLSRSDLEAAVLGMIKAYGLPAPQINRQTNGFEVDFRWPEQRLILEADGFAFHRTRRSFEVDRSRDRRLAVEGWRVVRITHRQLSDEPERIAADLRSLLRCS